MRGAAAAFAILTMLSSNGCQWLIGVEDGTPVACVSDNDCRSGEVCRNNACVQRECEAGCSSNDGGNGRVSSDGADAGDGAAIVDASLSPETGAGADAVGEADVPRDTDNGDGANDGAGEGDVSDGAGASAPIIVNITPAPPTLCTGRQARIILQAIGGTPPYNWTLDGATADLEVQDVANSVVTLSYTPLTAGNHSVGLADAAGQAAQQPLSLTVYETPRVVTTALPAACPAQAYSATLQAAGGDGSYTWSTNLAPDSGITLTGASITTTPQLAGTTLFDATVADSHCTSESATITLRVDPIGPQQCPGIGPDALPAPCLGRPYPVNSFVVTGGTPGSGGVQGFTWEAIPPLPAGLSFDSSTATLSGTALAMGTLTLQVTDGANRQVRRAYSMTPRDKCWLAYVSTQNGAGRLGLVDPVLNAMPDARHTFPQNPTDPSSVIDFQFSPNGRFIAYRMSNSSGAAQLALVDMSNLTERVLDLGGSVQHYAWSLDSSILAAAFQNQQGAVLGGIDVSPLGDGGTQGADGSALDVRFLLPISATVDSDLTWLGDKSVVFHAETAPGSGVREPSFSRYVGTQFQQVTQVLHNPYGQGLRLQGAPAGFFSFDPDGPFLDFDQVENDVTQNNYDDAVADPASQYVAAVQNGQLHLLPTATVSGITEDSNVGVRMPGCSTVLAWAPRRERLACIGAASPIPAEGGTTDSGSGSVARLFDVNSTGTALGSADVRGAYDGDTAYQRRRALSPSGNWLAFASGNTLFLADLRDGSARVAQSVNTFGVPSPAVPTDELAFSPDESLLLWQRDTTLFAVSVVDLRPRSLGNGKFLPPIACGEDFVESPNWCGRTGNSSLVWSADSRLAAAMMSSGVLRTWLMLSSVETTANVDACVQGCTGPFAFQP